MAVGDQLTNTPWDNRYTCPECYHDHHKSVTVCEGCGVALECTIERVPVYTCTVVSPGAGNAEDEDED